MHDSLRPRRLLCVGAATLDTIFRLDTLPSTSGKFIPTDAVEIAAGMASSAAIAAARLGAQVSLCARIGDDSRGTIILAGLLGEGIDCSRVRPVPGARSAFATILVDRTGERIIVPRYDPELLAATADVRVDDIGTFDAVLVDVRWPDAAVTILEAARRCGVPAVLDADVAAPDVLDRLVPLASHCVFSETAALRFTGTTHPLKALALLAERRGAALMAVTLGAAGCAWIDPRSGALQTLAAPVVSVVDTLSAGDVFHGVFALGIAEGRPLAETITRANAAAALKCTQFGGRLGSPRLDALEAFLAREGPSAQR